MGNYKGIFGECLACKRGHKLKPLEIEPTNEPTLVLVHYFCTDCGMPFRKWFAADNVSRAAKALGEADLPPRIRKTREHRGSYDKRRK